MRNRTALLGSVFVLVFFSGCVSNDAGPTGETAGDETAAAAPPFDLDLRDCREGGGVSLYNMNGNEEGPVPDGPFKRADIKDDTGNPLIASYFVPVMPGQMLTGIWHISVVCDSYAFNGDERGAFKAGWVGVKVLPPPWDDSGIERQFFIADFSFLDPDLVKALQTAGGIHASRMLDGRVDWLAPSLMHQVMDDENHGVFETHAKMKDYRAYESGTTRYWMLVAQAGHHEHSQSTSQPASTMDMTYRPVSFDVVDSAGDRHLVAEGTAWLSHTRTDAHGAVPGAAGNLAAVLHTELQRSITMGPSPEIYLNETWLH